MSKSHVKTGDKIQVISGKWKKENATVKSVITKNKRVVLNMIDLTDEKKKQIGVKTVKKSQKNQQGGIIERFVTVHISNVKKII